MKYESQMLIAGTWCHLKFHPSVKSARRQSDSLGRKGRVIRIIREIVLPHEIR